MPEILRPVDILVPAEAATNDDHNDSDYDDDDDYDPPMPFNHEEPWGDAVELWALERAKMLVAIHEGEPAFYENLDASIVEQWLFDDYPKLLEALKLEQALDSFRAELANFCARMTAAGAYTQFLLTGWLPETRANIQATFPELNYPRRISVDSRWNAQLPAEMATLYDRRRREALDASWPSDHGARHERFGLHVLDGFDLAKIRESSSDTGYVFSSDLWRNWFHQSREKAMLVVRPPAGMTESSCTSSKFSSTRCVEMPDGTIEAVAVFAGGDLLVPLARHESFFRQLRSRLPVLYVFDDFLLLVEYEWNLIEFGTAQFERLRREDPSEAILQRALVERPSTRRDLLIEHLRPLPVDESPKPTLDPDDSREDHIPF